MFQEIVMKKMKRFICLFVLMLGLAGISVPPVSFAIADAGPTPQTQKASKPFPPARYIPDHNFDTHHIALDLKFDWEHERLIGKEQISLAPLVADLKNIELDAANMTFQAVRLTSGTPLKYTFDGDQEKLRITLDRFYQPNENVALSIEYQTNGPMARKLSLVGNGIRFIKPTAEDPSRPKQIWSQGESEYNHYWFPCYDHPNDFFTSEIMATVEKPLIVISNGKLVETKENRDATRTFHWKMEQPHASYLSSIIVGEYTPITSEYADIPIISYVYPSEVEAGKVTTARLRGMVKFFSEKTGIKYPYAKYAQTMVRDFGGGMENISATTQTDNMIHDARTELDQTSDGLQSHELAHQWFGDYVTARSWSDIWLNESFATYFQAMWDEHNLGRDDFLYGDVKANQDTYFNTWKQGNRHPIVTRHYTSPDSVFDTYAYPRGGAVLHMLRKHLGEADWWRAINYYLRKYAHQPVQTEQFRIAIEESTGQSMDWFFDQWIYKMGHPIFRVTQDYDEPNRSLKLTVEQLQKIDMESQFPQAELFRASVDVEIVTAQSKHLEHIQIEPKRSQSYTFKVDSKPLLINFDYNRTIIKELDFNKTVDELTYQLSKDEDVLGRIWALDQLKEKLNMSSESEKERIASAIAGRLKSDQFWGVRLESAAALKGMKGESIRHTLVAATKDRDARVRASAVNTLAASNDPALADLYRQLLNDQSYGVIKAAALALGQTKSPNAYESLVKLLEVPSWKDNIKASAVSGLAALTDTRARELAYRYVSPGNRPQVRAAALRLIGNLAKDDPKAYTVLSEAASVAVDRLDFNLINASFDALATQGDPRALSLLKELGKKAADVPALSGLIAQYEERLQKSLGTAAKPAVHP
jgi:aminopeptidase N